MDPYDLYACPGCGLWASHRLDCTRRERLTLHFTLPDPEPEPDTEGTS